MKNTFKQALVMAVLALGFIGAAQAQTDQEYVQAVGAEFRFASVGSVVFGKATTHIVASKSGVYVSQSSGNIDMDNESLRAAQAVPVEFEGAIQFPITFNAPTGVMYVQGAFNRN